MNEKQNKLGIVVVNYKTPAHLAMCLTSIGQYVDNHEIIIVDNGEDEHSKKVIENTPFEKKTLFEKNIGFCKSVNKAVKNMVTEYFAVIPADCMVTLKWKATLLKAMKNIPKVGIVGPMCTQTSGPQGIEVGGMIDQPIPLQRIILNGAMMRTETFKSIGGLDERFPNKGGNFCDDDLGRRYVIAGYKNWVMPVLIFHNRSASYWGDVDAYTADIKTGREYFTHKWFKK